VDSIGKLDKTRARVAVEVVYTAPANLNGEEYGETQTLGHITFMLDVTELDSSEVGAVVGLRTGKVLGILREKLALKEAEYNAEHPKQQEVNGKDTKLQA
jgi:hypothetical protein